MEIELMDARMSRLHEAGMTGMWLVNQSLTNIDDLLNSRPGMIVRVKDIHNAVKFIPVAGEDVSGCIAGWISDEDGGESKTDADRGA
jgi:predicted RNase H-like nuclease